jgi:hypothetical protein
LIPAGKYELVIHTDDSPCQTAIVMLDFVLQRKATLSAHPSYSPDIAPSDFLLFADLKRELRGFRFRISEDVLVEMRKLVGEISPETLLDAFHNWIACCESLIASDGNYFE